MSKKYLLLCNRHNSMYGDTWCYWWGNREGKSGYTSDIRIAHRFNQEEIESYAEKGYDIPVPIDIIGVSEEYEPKESYNENLRVLVEKSTLNLLMNLDLKPLFREEEILCPSCGYEAEEVGYEEYRCIDCEYEFNKEY